MKSPEIAIPEEVVLDKWEEVYDAVEDREPDPNVASLIAEDYAKYNPTVIVAEGANEKIAELLEDGYQFTVNINHIHEKDTGLAVRALSQTAFKAALARSFVLAKHEHFNGKYKLLMEKIAIPVFQPEKHKSDKFRRALVAAGKRLEEVTLYRVAKKKQHAIVHGEGKRNTTEDKNKVDRVRAILGRIAIGARKRGVKVAYLGVGLTYPDPEDPHNAFIKIGMPETEFPDSPKEFAEMAQADLQELVDDARIELQEFHSAELQASL